MSDVKAFWKNRSIDDFSAKEWETLCDGCGICCLYKVNGERKNATNLTRVACRFLDLRACTCGHYKDRQIHMPTCIKIEPDNVLELTWLPETCAYFRVAKNKPLPWWHYLRSGDKELVHELGISVKGKVISEKKIDLNDLNKYVIKAW